MVQWVILGQSKELGQPGFSIIWKRVHGGDGNRLCLELTMLKLEDGPMILFSVAHYIIFSVLSSMFEIFQKKSWPSPSVARPGFSCLSGSLDGYRRQVQASALEDGLGPKFTFAVGLSCHSRTYVGGLMSPGPNTGPGTQLVLWVNLPVTNKSLCRTRARSGRSLLTSHLKVAAEYGRLGGEVRWGGP